MTPSALLGASTLATVTTLPTPLAAATTADVAAATTANLSLLTTANAQLNTPTAPPAQQPSPTNTVLYGDSGTLIQAYGAVALVAGTQALPPVYSQAVTPLVSAVAPVTGIPRVAKVA